MKELQPEQLCHVIGGASLSWTPGVDDQHYFHQSVLNYLSSGTHSLYFPFPSS